MMGHASTRVRGTCRFVYSSGWARPVHSTLHLPAVTCSFGPVVAVAGVAECRVELEVAQARHRHQNRVHSGHQAAVCCPPLPAPQAPQASC